MERLTKRTENSTAVYNTASGDPVKWGNNRYKVLQKLAEYEDLEEQGKLLKLPAVIDETIFFIWMGCPKDYEEEYCRDHEGSCENCLHRVPEIVSRDFRMSDIPNMDKIFATREEAEAALKELVSDNAQD